MIAIRSRIAEYCQQESSPLVGKIEVDESYFGARRVKGKLRQALKEHFSETDRVQLITLDLSKKDSTKALYQQCDTTNLEVLVNNAGIGKFGEHSTLALDKIQTMLMLNILTLTKLCALFGADMKKNKSGYISNIASLPAYQPMPYFFCLCRLKKLCLKFFRSFS